MHRIEKTTDLIKQINRCRKKEIEDSELISTVCDFFDFIKDEIDLSQADFKFLKYISNLVGIPHYFDLLSDFSIDSSIKNYSLSTIWSLIYEESLFTSYDTKVHKLQKNILNLFQWNIWENKYFLSASTSFWKTHLVYEIINKKQYENILLIFPTIALLSENLEKIVWSDKYSEYSIHTLSDIPEFWLKNIFIYTPERYLSFLEKNDIDFWFDFIFIDEVYKIDNEYIIWEEVQENERDLSYRLAAYYALKNNADVLLAGPYINFSSKDDHDYNPSFDKFLSRNSITLLNYNEYEIVNKSYTDIKTKKHVILDDKLQFQFESTKKDERLIEIINEIRELEENSIIYCYSKTSVENYSKKIIKSWITTEHDISKYKDFIDHLSNRFYDEWCVIKGLKAWIGIHHGLIPKYIQKEIIYLFNTGLIHTLLSTTTITEWINTSAKNLIVLHNKKWNKNLKMFDAKNIAGRAWRFLHHYKGRVIVLQNDFLNIIDSAPEAIKHKNYDIDVPKDEIDIFFTEEEFLKTDEKIKRSEINKMQQDRWIPDEIFNQYKVVSRLDKIKVYDSIKCLNSDDFQKINNLKKSINAPSMGVDFEWFELLLKILKPIIKNQKLLFFIDQKDKNDQFSLLTILTNSYLSWGFEGSMSYNVNNRSLPIDKAIRETAEFIYNLLKYHVVKYLGVFNLMYKFYISQRDNIEINTVSGIDKLLLKLEYNALSPNGKLASDYGVPSNVLHYYEALQWWPEIQQWFDSYEMRVFNKFDNILMRNIDKYQ